MNIFWNIRTLDNKRLAKQCLELNTIVKNIGRLRRGERKEGKGRGYHNHPVVRFYLKNVRSLEDAIYKTYSEYILRFNKYHKLQNKTIKELKVIITIADYDGNKRKCFVNKNASKFVKTICKIADKINTTLAYWLYCKLGKK